MQEHENGTKQNKKVIENLKYYKAANLQNV